MPLPLIPLNLADIVINTFLYGIFFVLNTVSIGLLCSNDGQRPPRMKRVIRLLSQPMFLGAVALSVTITAHWICNVMRLFQAFEGRTTPLEYYADLSQKIYAVKTGLIMASVVSGDLIIVYRLWVVWNRKYSIILLPLLSVIGVAVGGSGITYELASYEKGKDIFSASAQAWVICEAIFTVLTNVYSTGLIAWRIWTTNRRCSAYRSKKTARSSYLTAVTAVLIESALLYSSFLIVFIATYIAKHRIESLIVDCLPPVAGISFGLINLRCHRARAKAASQEPTVSAGPVIDLSRGFGVSTSSGAEGDRDGRGDLAYPMQPLAIHIAPDVQSSEAWTHGSQLERPKPASDSQC
ncbi:hypothetical protein PM082_016122 [Marasmius tenuissimus]|nr:hypothetical protein PM082_016122 [Marasmius tenuissimus]